VIIRSPHYFKNSFNKTFIFTVACAGVDSTSFYCGTTPHVGLQSEGVQLAKSTAIQSFKWILNSEQYMYYVDLCIKLLDIVWIPEPDWFLYTKSYASSCGISIPEWEKATLLQGREFQGYSLTSSSLPPPQYRSLPILCSNIIKFFELKKALRFLRQSYFREGKAVLYYT
jgi:hypothetical protein